MSGTAPAAGHPANYLEGAIRPFQSKIVGIACSALFGLLIFLFSMWLIEGYLHAANVFALMASIVLAFGGAEEFYRNGNIHDVPVGYAGVATLFSARVHLWSFVSSRGYMAEGRHWLVPFIMNAISVNMQVQDSDTRANEDLVSKDGDKMVGEFFFVYEVTDPFTWLGTEHAEATLLDIAESEERDAFAQESAMQLATDSDKKKGVARRMTDALRREARRFGIGVIETKLMRSQPPQEVLDANAQLQVEEAQLRSEGLEMDGVIERIKKLKKAGLTAKEASDAVFGQVGKIKTTRSIHKIEGLESIGDNPAVARLLRAIFKNTDKDS